MEDAIKNEDDIKKENEDYLKKWRQLQKLMRGGGLSTQTMFSAPDTSKSCKWHSSIANWNYSGLGQLGLVQ